MCKGADGKSIDEIIRWNDEEECYGLEGQWHEIQRIGHGCYRKVPPKNYEDILCGRYDFEGWQD